MDETPSKPGSAVKHNFNVTINAGLADVWKAFDNPDNMTRWVRNLESFEHRSGDPGQPGAVSVLTFDENGRSIEMIETITERREPDFLAGVYDTKFGKTLIVNTFAAIDEHTTRWESWCNFSFKGLMKIMSLFMSGTIRKRTDDDMQRFKLMVESDASGGS